MSLLTPSQAPSSAPVSRCQSPITTQRAARASEVSWEQDQQETVTHLSKEQDLQKMTTHLSKEQDLQDVAQLSKEQDLQDVAQLSKEQDLQDVAQLSKEQGLQNMATHLSKEQDLQETVAHLSRTFQWEELSLLLKHMNAVSARRLVSTIVDPVHRHSLLTACLSVIASVTTIHDDPPGAATYSDMCDTCQVLLTYGADVNHQDWRGRTAVHWAAMAGRVDLLGVFLSFAADITIAENSGQVALHYAVTSGSQACVDLLLQHDVQVVNVVAGHGLTPLILAVQQGHEAICRQLLEAGADVTAQEATTRRTPLHYALYLKRLDLFNLLLKYNPDLTAADHRGTSVVHRCCAVSDVQYLSQLLAVCDKRQVLQVINMADSEGATPVIIACQNGHLSHLSALLAHGASVSDRDAHGRTALHHCVENPDTACAELLLKSDPSLLATTDDEGLTPLHLAVIAANVPLIRLLLKRGASLTCRDHQHHTVAHWATVCGHAGVLDVLLEYDVELSSPDAHQAYPVHYAAQVARPAQVGHPTHTDSDELQHSAGKGSQEVHGNLHLLRKLLDHGVSPEVRDKDMRTPIIWAASAGNADACGMLVAAGANPDTADKDGLCALHCAASRGHTECVRQLVTTCGAGVDPTDHNQCTPLFYAITLGHTDCVTTLLQLGARSAHTDNRGRNTAHCAAVKGSRDVLESLRAQEVDVWRPTIKGDYPVHEAAQAGHVEVVQYLLDESPAGTDKVNVANKEGRTCLHIAALTNNLRLAKVLLDRGADVNAVMKTKGKSYTSYDAAVAKGYKEAADYLLFRGGVSVGKLKEASSVTEENGQQELVDQSNATQQGAHAQAGEIQAPPVTVVVVSSSPAREIGQEFLLVGGRQLQTERSEEVDEMAQHEHSRHSETPGASGDVEGGLTVTSDDNEVEDKNKSVTVAFPQTETPDALVGETEVVSSTETRDRSTPDTTNIPATETRDGPTNETRDGPTNETRDGPTNETRDGPTNETRDGPTNETRDGPTTDEINMIKSERRDITSETRDALTLQTKDLPTAESRDPQITETRDKPSTEIGDKTSAETEDMPTTETGDRKTSETRDALTLQTKDIPTAVTEDIPTVQTGNMPTAETGDMLITETGEKPITQTRGMPTAEIGYLPVRETGDISAMETKDMPITETRDMPTAKTGDVLITETVEKSNIETRDMSVTETRHMPTAETADLPVRESRDMPSAETKDMPVTETRDMSVTEGTLSAQRESEAVGDEDRDSLTNDLTNKAPSDSNDLGLVQCLNKKETAASQLPDKLHGEHETGMTQTYKTPKDQAARTSVVELTSISTERYEYVQHEMTVDTQSPQGDTTRDSPDTANDTKCSESDRKSCESDDTVTDDRKCRQSKDTIAETRQLSPRLPMVTAKKGETTKPGDDEGREVSQKKAPVVSGQTGMTAPSLAAGSDESQHVTKCQQESWQHERHKQVTTEPQQPDERQEELRMDHVTGQHLVATCTPFSGASGNRNAMNGTSKGRKDTGNNGISENRAQNGAGAARKRSKKDHDDGDLNHLSNNDNADAGSAVNMSPSGETQETKAVCKVCEEKGLGEATTGKEQRFRRPRTSHVILEVQASVRRFERERRSIRALQQVRRAHVTNSSIHDLTLFRSLLLVGGSKHHQETRFKTEEKKSRSSQAPNKLDKRKQLLHCDSRGLQRRRSKGDEDMEEDSADRCPDPSTTPTPPKHRGDSRVRPPCRSENHRETSKELSPRLLLREWQQEHHMKVQRSLVLAYSHQATHHALPAINHSGKQRSSCQSSQANTSRPSRPSTTRSLWVSRSHPDSPVSTTRTDHLTSSPVPMTKRDLTSGPSGVSRAQFGFIRHTSTTMTS